MENLFDTLKTKFKTHKAAAAYLGVSYSRYNDWRWEPARMPKRARRMMEMAAEMVAADGDKPGCDCRQCSAHGE
jgi:hypothetical protein